MEDTAACHVIPVPPKGEASGYRFQAPQPAWSPPGLHETPNNKAIFRWITRRRRGSRNSASNAFPNVGTIVARFFARSNPLTPLPIRGLKLRTGLSLHTSGGLEAFSQATHLQRERIKALQRRFSPSFALEILLWR